MEAYTADQANRILPEVRAHVRALRDGIQEAAFHAAQAEDLVQRWGPEVHGGGSPEADAHRDHTARALTAKTQAAAAAVALDALGVVVKDPLLGLVDFPANRDGMEIELCWQDGEDEVAHWHPRGVGFAGRRPL